MTGKSGKICYILVSGLVLLWEWTLPLTALEKPAQWGEKVSGVITRFVPQGREVALTLDACGGKKGSGYDAELLNFLRKNRTPATLFINARWIEARQGAFLELAQDPLFDVQNHGTRHVPCSVTGRAVYGIKGTQNPREVQEEVRGCAKLITELTGKKPYFFRSGTAYYDDLAIGIIQKMGYRIIGFSILGDGGATFGADTIAARVGQARPGDIIICHMNHPEKSTMEGLSRGIALLLEKGFSFVLLRDRELIPLP